MTRNWRLAVVSWAPSLHHPRLYSSMVSHGRIDLTVYFCAAGPLERETAKQIFGSAATFGDELLEGYRYRILPNWPIRKSKPGKTRVGSHCNFGVWSAIARGNYDSVIIDTWNDLTFWLAAAAARYFGIPYLVCGDATILAEAGKPLPWRLARRAFLQRWFFARASGALYRCEMNRRFYESFGVPAERTFFYPFPVDLETYRPLDRRYQSERLQLREQLGIRADAFAILFAGRFAPEKRVPDLIDAYARLELPHKQLFLVGDGPLRSQIEAAILRNRAPGVRLTGFLQRDEVLKYYAACDALVLPSGSEPHGDVVMEGMCFGLPPVVSNRVGAAYDAVRNGWNGLVYPCGEVRQLTRCLEMLGSAESTRLTYGERCREAVRNWGYDSTMNGLVSALEAVAAHH